MTDVLSCVEGDVTYVFCRVWTVGRVVVWTVSEGDMPDTCGYGLLCGQSVRET